MNSKKTFLIGLMLVCSLGLMSCAAKQKAVFKDKELTTDQRTIIRWVTKGTKLTIKDYRTALKEKGIALRNGYLFFHGGVVKETNDLIIIMSIVFDDAKDKPFIFKKSWSPCPSPKLLTIQKMVNTFVKAAMAQMIKQEIRQTKSTEKSVLFFLFSVRISNMECQQPKNIKECPCTYDCDKKGFCCQCLAYHRQRNELPACYFSKEAEKTYDRSIAKFIEDQQTNG